MKEENRKTRRLWWMIPLAVLLLAACGAMLLYLAGSRGLSVDADNPRLIRSAYDVNSFDGIRLLEDGTLELRLEKADLYWFAREYGLSEQIRRWLDSDKDLVSAGFRLNGSTVSISLSRRAGGIFPLSYRGIAELEYGGQSLRLQMKKVTLGAHLPIGESQWPTLFRRELSVDLSGTDFVGELQSAELADSTLRLRLNGLTGPREGTLHRDREIAAARRLYGLDSRDSLSTWQDGAVTAEALCRSAVESGDARSYLVKEMSLCAAEDLPLLWEGDSSLARRWLWEPLRIQAESCRQELERTLNERRKPYENLLLAVREIYRSGALGIWETGFYNPATGEAVHPGTLSKLAVTAIDSRIVFLTTAGDEAAPGEMPDMLTVPRKIWRTMDRDLDWKADVDLGVLLTTEGEVPILLYRRGNGTLVLREVTEELYVSAMVSRSAPQVDLDSLPPMTETATPAGEGFSGGVIGFLAPAASETQTN